MLLFTIVCYDEKEDVMNELSNMKKYFEQKGKFIGISEYINSNLHFIKMFCDDSDFDYKFKDRFNLYMANILYKIIIEEFYSHEIYNFLSEGYFFLRYDETREIAKESFKILKNENYITGEDTIYYINKKNNIIDKIKSCIEENPEINIQGFITFRMKELRDDLEGIINKVVENYIADKEYKEFIKLLKYFVDIQDSKIDEVNIAIKTDGTYIIKDKLGQDILFEILNDIPDINQCDEINMEDLIISGLITYCPNSIIIHSENNCKNKEIINTIKEVFGEKVHFCNNCKMCKSINNIIKV